MTNGNVFVKSVGDSFSNAELEGFLLANDVDMLYLVGADATACVCSTAQGGLNRGYKVFVVEDAIVTASDMGKVLAQYEKDAIGTIDLSAFAAIK